MSSKNEVITLQLGHYSNFVGSHWWNLQEGNFIYRSDVVPEINYDVLYREGQNLRKEVTFTPRVLITDLKASLKNLPQFSTLYEESLLPDSSQLWEHEKVQIEKSEPSKANEFIEDLEKLDESIEGKVYDLDNEVEVWSDFLGTKFHPRTLTIINEYSHGNLEQPFESFTQGKQAWNDEIFQDTWVDNCRLYAEECDQLQGFQVLFDCYDGFSGLTCSAMQHLKDEYSQKCIISFPMIASNFTDTAHLKSTTRIVNTVLSINELGEMSDMFVPLYTGNTGWMQATLARQWPNIKYNNDLWYHSSALLASFMDTVTLSYRKRDNIFRMSSLCSTLTGGGRTCVGGSLNMPFPMQANDSVLEILEKCNSPLWTSVTPNFEINDNDAGLQNVVLRGIPKTVLFPRNSLKRNEMNASSADEILAMYLQYTYTGSFSRCVNTFSVPLKCTPSFPNIFNSNITKFGHLSDVDRSLDEKVEECASITGLHNTNSCRPILGSLHEEAKTIDVKQCPMIRTCQLELLEYTEALEKVLTHSESYD